MIFQSSLEESGILAKFQIYIQMDTLKVLCPVKKQDVQLLKVPFCSHQGL